VADLEREFPRFIYVPWRDDVAHTDRGDQVVAIAQALAAKTRIPLLGVAATLNTLPDSWDGLPRQTLKSSNGSGGAKIEIHFWPSTETFSRMNPSRAAHAFVLEFGNWDLSGWARHNGAVHFDTKDLMRPAISDEALDLYKRIEWNGNNSWFDSPGKRDALHDLRRLRELDELDLVDLTGYMVGKRSASAIQQLAKLAAKI